MKFNLKFIKYFLILLPFLLVFVAEIISFRQQSLGASMKLLAILYMFVYGALKLKYDYRLIATVLFFLPFFFYHIYISFNINAAIEEAIRYLFPIVVLFYGYSIRNHYLLLINFIILYAVLNNLYQPISYYNWLRDVHEQWFYNKVKNQDIYYYNETMGVIRAVGLIGFFAAYGFLNLVAYFLTKQFYYGKRKKLLLILFVLGIFSSLSFKAIGAFVFLLFLLSEYKGKILTGIVFLSLIILVIFPKKVTTFIDEFSIRIESYVTEGNSARAESYRVMFRDIADFRLIGRGIGSFGGASSTKYDSPVYEEVDFDWHKTKWLATTDTYFPHAFVEMGIIGAVLYFSVLIAPLARRHYKKEVLFLVFVIYFSLFFDSIFSFALNNLIYLMLSLVLIYPILQYGKDIETKIDEYSNLE